MPKPEVSICIPTYEQTTHLTKLLESLLIQTFQDFEVIITDDSRSDQVAKLVEIYQPKFKQKFTFIRNQPSKGVPENWNFALSKAQGRLIKIMHHDDWFTYHDSLAYFVTEFDRQPTCIFYSASLNYYPKKDTYYVRLTSPDQLSLIREKPHHLIFHNYIGVPSCTIFQNQQTLKFDQQLIWRVDVAFYVQLLLATPKIHYTNRPLVTTSMLGNHNITNAFIQGNPKELEELFHLYAYLHQDIAKEHRHPFLKFIGYQMVRYQYTQMQKTQDHFPTVAFPRWMFTLARLNKVSKLAAKVFLKTI